MHLAQVQAAGVVSTTQSALVAASMDREISMAARASLGNGTQRGGVGVADVDQLRIVGQLLDGLEVVLGDAAAAGDSAKRPCGPGWVLDEGLHGGRLSNSQAPLRRRWAASAASARAPRRRRDPAKAHDGEDAALGLGFALGHQGRVDDLGLAAFTAFIDASKLVLTSDQVEQVSGA